MSINSGAITKDMEGGDVKHLETSGRGGLTAEEIDFIDNFPEEKRKKVLAKIDVSLPRGCLFEYL
jgi:hypothetical protein